MADTHEEQLLTDLLGRIAREDAFLDAAHLEARVIDAVDSASARSIPVSFGATRRYVIIAFAAAILAAVFVPATLWLNADLPARTTEVTLDAPGSAPLATRLATPTRSTEPTPPTSTLRAAARKPTRVTNPTNITNQTNPTNLTNPTNPTNPSYSRDEFMPLMPLTERELAGPFQIVRVQMPRASLGTLRLPLEHPNEVIEADVLLGEDGMARAIRVSASGSVYPWRSR